MQKYTKIKSITTGGACCWVFKVHNNSLCDCVRVLSLKMTNWWPFGGSTRPTKEWSLPSWMKKLSLICLTIPPNFPSQTFQLSKHDFFKACAKSSSLHNIKPVALRCIKFLKRLIKVTSRKVSLMLLKDIVSSKRMVYTAMGDQLLNIMVVCPCFLRRG